MLDFGTSSNIYFSSFSGNKTLGLETKGFVKCCENIMNESIMPKAFTAQSHRAKADYK